MDRRIVLEEAMKIVSGEREEQYGSPKKNFEAIAILWGNYIWIKCQKVLNFTSEDIANMMILLKMARNMRKGTDDSWIDIAGYAALGAELADQDGDTDSVESATISTSMFTATAQPDGECFKHP